jgi:putative transposase
VFTAIHMDRTEEIMPDVRRDFRTDLAEFSREADHCRLLVNFPPKTALSPLVNGHTGASSQRPRREFPDPARQYRQANWLWPGPCFAASADGAPISVLRQHIEQQNHPA